LAAVIAIGGGEMWRERRTPFGRIALTATILTTGTWSWRLLGRNADWLPPLRWTILALSVIATVAVLLALRSPSRQRLAAAAMVVAVLVAGAGSAAYAFATIGQSHEGGGARVGPAVADANGPRHGGWDDDSNNAELDALLKTTHTTWSAAINGSSAAAGLELSTGTAVMAIGGFSGADPVPTLSQFQADVANHRIAYYIAPDPTHGFGRGRQHVDITRWVETNFPSVKKGSATVYDLSKPAG
jgi:4-amino-4-deoxy-L-arabinose transferase-like glycosyltransferase